MFSGHIVDKWLWDLGFRKISVTVKNIFCNKWWLIIWDRVFRQKTRLWRRYVDSLTSLSILRICSEYVRCIVFQRVSSENGAGRNNLTIFNFRKQAEMPAKTTWLKIPVLFFHNFVKESKKLKLLTLRLIHTSFHELIFVRKKKVRCTGNFPFRAILYEIFGLWTGTVDCGLSMALLSEHTNYNKRKLTGKPNADGGGNIS